MIYKKEYKKYKNKYSTSKNFNLVLDKKEYKINLFHKGVLFASLNQGEYNVFKGWTNKEQLNFLNGYWNFYISLQD